MNECILRLRLGSRLLTLLQCDETHPTCNNCKKSKRECLGYDPIFRQQPGAQPASHIQPAPISSQLAVPSSVPSTVPSSSALSSSSVAIGHSPANSYGSQPSMLPGSYSTTPSPSALPPSSTTHTVTASNNYHSPVLANTTLANHTEPGPDYSAAAAKSEPVFDFSGTIDRSNRHLPAPHVQDLAKPLDYNKDHHIMTTTGGDTGCKAYFFFYKHDIWSIIHCIFFPFVVSLPRLFPSSNDGLLVSRQHTDWIITCSQENENH